MRLLTALIVLVRLGDFALPADTPAEPITRPGEQTLFDGKVKVQVADDGTMVRIEVAFIGAAGSTTERLEAKSVTAKGWFVFSESPGRVWVYRGGDSLFLMEYGDNPPGGPAGSRSSTVALAPNDAKTAAALAIAPKAVVDRLPSSFKTRAKPKSSE